MPTFLSRARDFQGLHCQDGSCLSTDSYGFGVVTIVTGVLGGSIGTLLSRSFRDRLPHVDPLICAVGLLTSVPCLIASIFTASTSIATAYVFAFLGEALVAMNWAVMADILLYIVIPNRRSTAEALQVMFLHLLGDCGSPYIVGAISDAIYRSNPETSAWSFHSLQYSITICPAVGFIGGLFYLVAVFYINDDRKAVLQFLEGGAVTEALADGNPLQHVAKGRSVTSSEVREGHIHHRPPAQKEGTGHKDNTALPLGAPSCCLSEWLLLVSCLDWSRVQSSSGAVLETVLRGRLNSMDPVSSGVSTQLLRGPPQKHPQLQWIHSPTLVSTTDTLRTRCPSLIHPAVVYLE
ncbi:Protein spinster -like protein 3 [Takifugu flavidus]|uniref:Protein spinster-like protein 3 n=1 Tax=Takifugu flavidus TaxID=433684 RepID=A0A5C6P4Y4_9TELE|nr:Protein spinster -like protein 3 [Takifugu flavidus]